MFCLDLRVISILIVLLPAMPAFGNFVGNDTSNFNPTHSGVDFVTVQSSETLTPGVVNASLYLNRAANSLPTTVDVNGKTYSSTDSVIFSDLNLAYGVSSNLDFGLSAAYLVNQTVDRAQAGAQFSGTGLNEIRAQTKFRVLKRDPFGIAVLGSVNVNQATDNPFSGDGGGPTLNLETALDYALGKSLFGFNIGYRLKDKGRLIPNAVYEPLGNEAIASIALSRSISPAFTLISEITGAMPTESVKYVQSGRLASEALLGVKYSPSETTSLQLGGGARLSEGLFTPDWRAYAGLQISFDLLHRTTTVVVQPPAVVTNTTELNVRMYNGFLPRDIEVLAGYDFDEIIRRHEFQLKTTVPPAGQETQKPPFETIRLENFDFDFGSAKIRDEYHPMLKRLAEYLGSEPKVLKVRVEGHTDSVGSPERNKKRSQERADALRDFLVGTGLIKGLRIEAVGFGSERPIADNSLPDGRKSNRRVEIRILRSLPPTPVRTD